MHYGCMPAFSFHRVKFIMYSWVRNVHHVQYTFSGVWVFIADSLVWFPGGEEF